MIPCHREDFEIAVEAPTTTGLPLLGPRLGRTLMSAWEYEIYHIGDTRSTEETERIAALGRDGWELVAVDQGHIYRGVIAILADP